MAMPVSTHHFASLFPAKFLKLANNDEALSKDASGLYGSLTANDRSMLYDRSNGEWR
jgi:hypothetical protein